MSLWFAVALAATAPLATPRIEIVEPSTGAGLIAVHGADPPPPGCFLAGELAHEAGTGYRLVRLCRDADRLELTALDLSLDSVQEAVLDVSRSSDGRERLLVGVAGGLDEILLADSAHALERRRLVTDEQLKPDGLDRVDLDGDGTLDLVEVTWAGLATYRGMGDGTFASLSLTPLPTVARSAAGQLMLRTDGYAGASPPAQARFAFAGSDGPRRWRLRVVTLSARGAAPPCSAFVGLSEPAGLVRLSFLGGTPPRVAALTYPAQKFEMLGEYKLLVAPVECDRTGKARAPDFWIKTPFVQGSVAQLFARDVDGDGTVDVLTIGQQGRLHPDLVVQVNLGLGGGKVSDKPLRWSRSADDVGEFSFDTDMTGDGLADLVYVDKRKLVFVASEVAKPGRVPLAAKPSAEVALPEGVEEPRLATSTDLDRDGARELILTARLRKSGKATPVLLVVRFR